MFLFRLKLSFFEGIAILVGTIIGAGVLAIPYAVNKVGVVSGFILLIVLTLAVVLRHLMLGEIVLRTHGNHQLVGYYATYLGSWAKYVMTAEFTIGLYGSMLAYTIGVGQILAALTGGSSYWLSIFFYCVSGWLIFFGLSLIKRAEFVFTLLFIIVVSVITVIAAPRFSLPEMVLVDFSHIGLPYGVMLFALAGATAIPEMKREMPGRYNLFKKAIIIGTVFPAIIYAVFMLITLGITGEQTTEIATVGLGLRLGRPMMIFGNLFAFFAMGTCMLTTGLALRDMYRFDYKMRRPWGWILTMVPPLILFLLGVRNFIGVVHWIGGILGGVASIFSIIVFWRARKHGNREPEYSLGNMYVVGTMLIVMYALGIWLTVY